MGVFDDIFGASSDRKLASDLTAEKVQLQGLQHQFDPRLPDPTKMPGPKAEGNFWSDITGGILGSDNSNIVKAHAAEVEKLRARKDQGKISQDEFLTRAGKLTAEYSSIDPVNAGSYQAMGSKVLGFDPKMTIMAERATQAEAEAANTLQIENTAIKEAGDTGTVFLLPDGKMDRPKMIEAGKAIQRQKAELDALKAAKSLETGSEAEKKGAMESTTRRLMTLPFINRSIEANMSQLDSYIKAHPGLTEEKQSQLLQENFGKLRAQTLTDLGMQLGKLDIPQPVVDGQMEWAGKQFDNMASMWTGPFSKAEVTKRAISNLMTGWELDVTESTETYQRAKLLYGEDTAGKMAEQAFAGRGGEKQLQAIRGSAQQGIFPTSPKQDAQQNLERGAGVLTGTTKYDKIHPEEVLSAFKTSTDILGHMAESASNGGEWTPTQAKSFSTGMDENLKYTPNLTNKDDLKVASNMLASPNMVNAVAKLAQTDPKAADSIGSRQNDLSTQALIRYANGIKFGSTTDTVPFEDMDRSMQGFRKPSSVTDYRVVFNPSKGWAGSFEVEANGKSGIPREYVTEVDTLNKLLVSSISTKDYGGKPIKGLTRIQYAQSLADAAGVGMTSGTNRVPYDKALASSVPVKKEVVQLGPVKVDRDGATILDNDTSYDDLPEKAEQTPDILTGLIDEAQSRDGKELPKGILAALAWNESSMGANLKPGKDKKGKPLSTSFGLFHVTNGTAAQFPSENKYTNSGNINIALAYLKRNYKRFAETRPDEATELAILAHFRGPDSLEVKLWPDSVPTEGLEGDALAEQLKQNAWSENYVRKAMTYIRKQQ